MSIDRGRYEVVIANEAVINHQRCASRKILQFDTLVLALESRAELALVEDTEQQPMALNAVARARIIREKEGLNLNDTGKLLVNEQLEVEAASGIYAIGDGVASTAKYHRLPNM